MGPENLTNVLEASVVRNTVAGLRPNNYLCAGCLLCRPPVICVTDLVKPWRLARA